MSRADFPGLSDHDYESLSRGSGLSDGIIRQRGYYTATTLEQLKEIGLAPYQTLVPALVVPIHSVDRDVTLHQIRPLEPRLNDSGKPIKYETTAGKTLRIDVPPCVHKLLSDPAEPLYITEGAKKADAAAMRGLVAIDLLGVWNWRGKGDNGGLLELADWDRIAIKGRTIFVAFDNDVMVKPSVRASLVRLAAMLKRRGAKEVHPIVFPPLNDDGKVGFDDFFVNGGRVAELDEYVDDSLLDGSIDVFGKSISDITPKALEALLADADPPRIYIRAGELARVVPRAKGFPVIESLRGPGLKGILARSALWKKKGTVIDPPNAVVDDLLDLKSWPGVGEIVTVSRCPVVTPEGKLSASYGYCEEAESFIATGGDIPEFDGSAADAARWILDDVLGDFPFSGDADRAHALAFMLLPIVRPFIKGPTPLHLFDAPVQGTGKSLAATICLIPTQGNSISVTSQGSQEEEFRKKISTALLSGAPYVFFDNLKGKIESSSFEACLTGVRWHDRKLSTMEPIDVPIRCVWLGTANNVSLSRDILRRTCWIRLATDLERPEDRTAYRHPHIQQWVTEHRFKILGALIRMVTEWINVRKPNQHEPVQYRGRKLGTFEEWSSIIGSILELSESFGFLTNIEELRIAADSEDLAYCEFYDRWYAEFGSSPVKAKDLLYTFKADEEIAGILGDKSETSQISRLGRILSSWIGVVRSAKRIVRSGGTNGSNSLKMELVKPKSPATGDLFAESERALPRLMANGDNHEKPSDSPSSPLVPPGLSNSKQVQTGGIVGIVGIKNEYTGARDPDTDDTHSRTRNEKNAPLSPLSPLFEPKTTLENSGDAPLKPLDPHYDPHSQPSTPMFEPNVTEELLDDGSTVRRIEI